MTTKEQKQGQPQVLRLRCAPLRMTDLWGGVKVGRQRQKRIPCGNGNKKQKQGQPQVLRLRCAAHKKTDLGGVKGGRQKQKRIPRGNDNKKAKARSTAGPSATLRSA